MKDEMKKFAQKEDHNNASCAVVAFLSHGENGKIKGEMYNWGTVQFVCLYFLFKLQF